ncbi:MAG: PAS domain S-box protein, partial [Thermoplasmatales archaeon]|nr:PAS domain S-box protein [Thermoplasmatales archaeon]
VPLFDEDGKFIGYRGVDKDITERKKMEQDLRIKDSAISSSINAIALVELDGKITYINPSFLNMWGYNSEEELLGKTAVRLWHRKGRYMDVVDAAFNKGGWVGELIAERGDGSLFDAQLSANIVKDENDNPICMMISFVDITKLKRLEEALTET